MHLGCDLSPVDIVEGEVEWHTAPELRRHDEWLEPLAQDPADETLGASVAVHVGGVDERHARVDSCMQRRRRFAVVDGTPVGADGPGFEADLGDRVSRPLEPPRVHVEPRGSTPDVRLSDLSIIVGGNDTTLDSEAMRSLPRHALVHSDGRRLLVYGELRGSLEDEVAGAAEAGARIHKRLDVFTEAWVGIAPARNMRPLDSPAKSAGLERCPFCPGGLEVPFPYDAAVFDNRFPSFRPDPPPAPLLGGPTGRAQGRCEVVLYTDRHDASFGDLSPIELARVVAIWTDRGRELWEDPSHAYVCVFENRGAEVGATIAHPHGQIYALDHVPSITAAKSEAHRRHRAREGNCLSCAATQADDGSSRVVAANESFVVAVPFAARWPFEVAVRARRHGLQRLADLVPEEQRDLAVALRDVARRYDALFDFPLPYMMVAQEAPNGEPDWHLAFELYPVHRAPGAMKIRASVETGLGLFLNDVAPEDAARRLAALEVPAEPIELDSLFAVTQPDAAMLS